MNKKFIILFSLIWLIVIAGFFWWRSDRKTEETPDLAEGLGLAALVPMEKKVDTPGAVAVAFFDYLNQGKYLEAEKLFALERLDPEFLKLIKTRSGSWLKESWENMPYSEKPEKVTVAKEEINGDVAEVWLIEYYPDGEVKENEESGKLVKIDGEWKMLPEGAGDNSASAEIKQENKASFIGTQRDDDLNPPLNGDGEINFGFEYAQPLNLGN